MSVTLRVAIRLCDDYRFFFNDTATTEIYTLSLHDALPISGRVGRGAPAPLERAASASSASCRRDRKSTRLNSSHEWISYAVFCLKKKTVKGNTAQSSPRIVRNMLRPLSWLGL